MLRGLLLRSVASIRRRLDSFLLVFFRRPIELQQIPRLPGPAIEVDLIISPNEISFAHGTGVLLTRLFENREKMITFRSQSTYGGAQDISAIEDFVLPQGLVDPDRIAEQVELWLRNYSVRRILCTPFFDTDVHLARAAKVISGAPLGIWIMDDNCLRTNQINRESMQDLLSRAAINFAISRELKDAYRRSFLIDMTILPPLVPASLINVAVSPIPTEESIVIIGNVWSPQILDRLSRVVQEAEMVVYWYTSNENLWSNAISLRTLKKRGIHILNGTDTQTVQAAVANASVVLVPSDPGDLQGQSDSESAIGEMSLPTRIPFILASAGTPIIVLGHDQTAAGNFVRRRDIGHVVPYEATKLKAAIRILSSTQEQTRIREVCAGLSASFSFAGITEQVLRSIDQGEDVLDRSFNSIC